MARWRLTQPHYLVVPGTFYTYEEIDGDTGRRRFKQFPVPLLVDPKDPSFCNRDGECFVAHEGSEQSRFDTVFSGPPTPYMEPMDDEARALNAEMEPKWKHPMDSLPANGGTDQNEFLKEMAAIMKGFAPSSAMPVASSPEFEAMKAQMAEMQAKLDAGQAVIGAVAETKPTANRRSV